jgi:ATP phosphoribosyltransferase regulatory subunit
VELLGAGGPAADAEVVALALTALLEAGLTNFQVGLGQVQFINGVMDESGLTPAERQRVKQCMVSRDLVGLGEILAGSALSATPSGLSARYRCCTAATMSSARRTGWWATMSAARPSKTSPSSAACW